MWWSDPGYGQDPGPGGHGSRVMGLDPWVGRWLSWHGSMDPGSWYGSRSRCPTPKMTHFRTPFWPLFHGERYLNGSKKGSQKGWGSRSMGRSIYHDMIHGSQDLGHGPWIQGPEIQGHGSTIPWYWVIYGYIGWYMGITQYEYTRIGAI